MLQMIRSAFSTVRTYQFMNLFVSGDDRVNHDNDCDSPLLSLERVILMTDELERWKIVGNRHVLFTKEGIFNWAVPIQLLNLSDTRSALINWSRWFSETLNGGQKMVDTVANFRGKICADEDSGFNAKRLVGQLKWITDPYQIWWRPLDNIFRNSDHTKLNQRYNKIAGYVKDAGGQLPPTGLTTLKRIWLLGREWKERGLLPDTPHKELNKYIEEGKVDQLKTWAQEVRKLGVVGQFHRYLHAVIANFELGGCEDRLARLELALEPELKELYAKEDGVHQRWVADIKGGWPVTVKGVKHHYVESLTDCVHRFKDEDDKERLLVFGERNGVGCYLAHALRGKGEIHFVPKGFGVPYFEIEKVEQINWEEPPDNLIELLKELEDKGMMPENLTTTLVQDENGKACWLPSENRISFDKGKVMLFLYQVDNVNAPTRIDELGYAERK